MKLEDVQATIDAYFEQISEQDLFELLTKKYDMPVVDDIESLPSVHLVSSNKNNRSRE
jgi:hypothetical protein